MPFGSVYPQGMIRTEKMEHDMIFNESLAFVYKALQEAEESYLRGHGIDDLTAREVYMLHEIKRLGKSTMTELANARHVAPGTITVAVNSLVKKGYIGRKKNEADRRIVHLYLTEKAEEVIELHYRFHDYFVDMVFDRIPELDRNEMALISLRIVNLLKVFDREMSEKYGSD